MLDTDFDPADHIRIRSISLQSLFLRNGPFHLPWAQRSYAWREEHVRRLLSDLLAGYDSAERPYFLGYVSTARTAEGSGSAIADGQQRLITLSLLFAELRSRIPAGEVRDCLTACLLKSSDHSDAIITLQENIRQVYLEQLVNDAGAADERSIEGDLCPPEQGLILNRYAIADALDASELTTPDQLEAFARFCLTRCAVAFQVVDSEEEALQMLATEEETGLPFHSIERSKVTLLSIMPRNDHVAAGELWSAMQARVGHDGLSELLSQLRIIKAGKSWRGGSNTPAETDLATQYEINKRGITFLREDLAPALDAYHLLRSCDEGATPRPEVAADPTWQAALTQLNWLDQCHWHIPAIAWLLRFGTDHKAAPQFFAELDRHAWIYRIANEDQKLTSRDFARLADRILSTDDPAILLPMKVPGRFVAAAKQSLSTRTFYYKNYAKIVLRRLSLLLGHDPGPSDNLKICGEHIMPRNPTPASEWHRNFGDKSKAKQYSDRIGNFCFLTPQDNDAIGNSDWDVKRPVLAASGLTLAIEAAEYDVWTRDTIQSRSDKLISLLREDLRF